MLPWTLREEGEEQKADFLHGIYNDIDNVVVSGVLFLDLKKAFNSVEHYIVYFESLEVLG